MISKDIVERMQDGHLVAHYLLASYAYYHLQESPMPDDAYDRLCERLAQRWEHVQHQHKHLIDRDALTAGTGYYLAADAYPLMLTEGIFDYLTACRNGKIVRLLEPHLAPLSAAPRVARRPVTATAIPATPKRVVRRPSPLQTAPPPPAPVTAGPKRILRRPGTGK